MAKVFYLNVFTFFIFHVSKMNHVPNDKTTENNSTLENVFPHGLWHQWSQRYEHTHTHKKALQSITKVVYFIETESFGLLASMLYDIYYIHLLICEISYIQNIFSNFSNKVWQGCNLARLLLWYFNILF